MARLRVDLAGGRDRLLQEISRGALVESAVRRTGSRLAVTLLRSDTAVGLALAQIQQPGDEKPGWWKGRLYSWDATPGPHAPLSVCAAPAGSSAGPDDGLREMGGCSAQGWRLGF